MKILGLSFDYHDSAAALLVDGACVAAAQEERFSRRKQDPRLPAQAIAFCLEQAGLTAAELDQVVFYEDPLLKLDRIRASTEAGEGTDRFHQVLARWLVERRLEVSTRIAEATGVDPARISHVGHHQTHAASAFFSSPFDEATIVTLDGVGEHETATISVGRGERIEQLASVSFPDSLGLFYSGFTAYLGFEINEGEYKVMGMAGFGEPVHADRLLACFDLRPDGSFGLNQDFFVFDRSDAPPYLPALTDWLGPPRAPSDVFDPRSDARAKHYADVAASIQRCAEEVILHVVGKAVERTGLRTVCLAGGVALNTLANGRIQRELGCRLYVQPAAGDAGGALGAAQYWQACVAGKGRPQPLRSAYLGKSFGKDAIEEALTDNGLDWEEIADMPQLLDRLVERLTANGVVGWLHGRAEWGPRALGCRSILASPIGPDMQRIVNEKIKFREPFRPFAPSVLKEHADLMFEVAPTESLFAPEHFMLSIARVRPEWQARIPAVTHVDGTARVHFVDAEVNPRFHALISAFFKRTGVPALLNTSFNLRGEPIVNGPADAIKTFLYSHIDTLVLENHLVTKPA